MIAVELRGSRGAATTLATLGSPRRGEVPDEGEPERSLLEANEYRKRRRNDASREGSAARTIAFSFERPKALPH